MRLESRRTRAGIVAAALTAAAMCVTTNAVADVDVDFVDLTLYHYDVTHVPDHDQYRNGLFDTGGKHCGPVSAVDWTCYFANHGNPGIIPGPGYWMHPALYDDATTAIDAMGTLMGTGSHGTYASDIPWGIRVFLGDHPAVTFQWMDSENTCPTAHLAATMGMGGGFVILGVGWYFEDNFIIVRAGGHFMPLSHAERDGGLMQIGIRDPRTSEGDPAVQGPFSTEEYDIEDRYVWPIGRPGLRTMSKMHGYSAGGKPAYIDSVTVTFPQFVLTTVDHGHIARDFTWVPAGSPFNPHREYALDEDASLRSMGLLPEMRMLYIGTVFDISHPHRLFSLDLLTGASDELAVNLDVPRDLTIGRLRDVYLIDSGDVVQYNVDAPHPQEINRITPVHPATALTYDDAGDYLLCLSADDHVLTRYNRTLDGSNDWVISPDVPIAGDASLCWMAEDDAAWFVSSASSSLWRAHLTDIGEILATETDLGFAQPPEQIQAGNGGRMLVSVDGAIVELEYDGTAWVEVADPWFDGVETDGPFVAAVSRTNYQEVLHGTSDWWNVLPEVTSAPIYDCDPDVNHTNVVEVSDLLAVLAAWDETGHNGFIREDVNQNGAVEVGDLLAVLAAWGPCP